MESYHDFITHMPERTIFLTIDPQQEEFSLYVIEQVVIHYWTVSSSRAYALLKIFSSPEWFPFAAHYNSMLLVQTSVRFLRPRWQLCY